MEILAIGILLFLVLRNQGTDTPPENISGFLSSAYSWLAQKAGGLSNGTTGGDVNLLRAPCTSIKKNGVVMNPPPHTSADVTYKTYFNLGPVLGYDPTCEGFAALSVDTANNPTWRKIVNWHFAKGNNFSSNPVIAAYIGLWYWGGWNQNIVSPQDVRDAISDSADPQKQLDNLVALRKYYFSKLPYSSSLIAAWQNRAESFLTTFSKYV